MGKSKRSSKRVVDDNVDLMDEHKPESLSCSRRFSTRRLVVLTLIAVVAGGAGWLSFYGIPGGHPALFATTSETKHDEAAAHHGANADAAPVKDAHTLPPVNVDVSAETAADMTKTLATVTTDLGTMVIKLRPDAAPRTVDNFVRLVKAGVYDGARFTRYEKNFTVRATAIKESPFAAVPLEVKLPNVMYSVHAARGVTEPDSHKTGFSISLADNSRWLVPGRANKWGYTVFGHVISGMEVLDKFLDINTKLVNFFKQLDPPVEIRSIVLSDDLMTAN